MGDGFCIENPLPVDGDFEGGVALDREHVWAVNAGGAVLRFDGTRWRAEEPSLRPLRAVSATRPDDLYVCGNRLTLRHYDGSTWSDVPVEGGGIGRDDWLNAVLVIEEDELLVGTLHRVAQRRGGTWSSVASAVDFPRFSDQGGRVAVWGGNSVWLRGADGTYARERVPAGGRLHSMFFVDGTNAFAAGSRGEVMHREARGWRAEMLDPEARVPTRAIMDVAGRSVGDAWAVSGQGRVFHYDGRTWSRDPVPWEIDLDSSLRRVEVLEDGRVIAVGTHLVVRDLDGHWTSTALVGDGYRLARVLVRSGPNEAWAFGPKGLIAHFDGRRWRNHSGGITDARLVAISGTTSSRVHAVGASGSWLRRTAAGGWERVLGARGDLRDVLVREDDVIAVGEGGVMYRWTRGAAVPLETGVEEDLGPIVVRDGQVIVAGGHHLYRLDGTHLERWVTLPGELRVESILAQPSGELLIGTEAGGVVSIRGTRVRIERRERFDREYHDPLEETLTVLAVAPDGVVYASTGSEIVRREGRTWAAERRSVRIRAFAIVDSDVWAFGERIWRRGASGWTVVPSGIQGPIADATVTSDGVLFIAGRSLIARRPSRADGPHVRSRETRSQ